MSVYFLRGDIPVQLRAITDVRFTLYGKPFPSDELMAYWSMVPDDITITVRWYFGLSMFQVCRVVPSNGDEGHNVIEKIFATDALKLDVWMDVIARLARVGL
jgi:hypothetical protein